MVNAIEKVEARFIKRNVKNPIQEAQIHILIDSDVFKDLFERGLMTRFHCGTALCPNGASTDCCLKCKLTTSQQKETFL